MYVHVSVVCIVLSCHARARLGIMVGLLVSLWSRGMAHGHSLFPRELGKAAVDLTHGYLCAQDASSPTLNSPVIQFDNQS